MKAKNIIVAVIKCKDKILILRRRENKRYDPDKWEFVSSFITEGSSLETQAVNQVLKETGLTTNLIKSGTVFKVSDEYGEWLITPFLVETTQFEIKLVPDDHSEYKWIDPAELNNFRTVKDLEQNLKALGLAQ